MATPPLLDIKLCEFMRRYMCKCEWNYSENISAIYSFNGDKISIVDARKSMYEPTLLLKLVGEKCFLYGPDCYEKVEEARHDAVRQGLLQGRDGLLHG